MSQCIAKTTKRGCQCKHTNIVFESLCRLHHNINYRNDEAYKARYDSRPDRVAPVLMHEEEEEGEDIPAPAPAPAKKKPVRMRVAPVLMHGEEEEDKKDKEDEEDEEDEEYIPVPVKKRVQRKREPKVPPPAPIPEEVAPTPEKKIVKKKREPKVPPPPPTPEKVSAAGAARKVIARNEYLEKVNTPSADQLLANALYILNSATVLDGIDGYNYLIKESSKIYTILRYYPINANVLILLKAVVTFDCFTSISFSDNTIHTISNEQKEELLEGIKTALINFGEFNVLEKIPRTDKYFKIIRNRVWRIQDEERTAAAAAAAEAARVARVAELAAIMAAMDPAEIERRRLFAIQLREAPVVFKRDPEGGIDLAAFATDMQNIHRSSVQTSTQKAVAQLMLRYTDPDQDTLPEITKDLQDPKKVCVTGVTRERVIMELQHDYYESVAFSVPYGDVLDRVWTFIRSHTYRNDIFIRLAQEIAEGIGMCTNGKMARLINVLQGFDETLLVEAPKEVFQDKFALLRKLPKGTGEQGVAAQALFEEFSIPEAERAVWLEALLEE